MFIVLLFPACSEPAEQKGFTDEGPGFVFANDKFSLNETTVETSCIEEGENSWVFEILIKKDKWQEFSALTQGYVHGKIAFVDGDKVYSFSTLQEPFETRDSVNIQIQGIEEEEAVALQNKFLGETRFCDS